MNEVYLLCRLSRQAHHKARLRLQTQREKQTVYIRLMEQVRAIHPGMGLRTIYEMAGPDGIGRDAFIALGLREGFRLKAAENKARTTYSIKTNRYANLLSGRWFTGVNQLWSSDITYVYCLKRFYYLVLVMDVYSRRIIGYSVADNMRAENNFEALKMALHLRGITNYGGALIHHSDKGGQYASDRYTETLDNYGIQISMCNEVYENTHIERLNETIKNQYLYRMEIKNEADLRRKVAKVIAAYNLEKPHESLHKMTPAVYEAHITNIARENRTKMQIYTVQKDREFKDPNQLKLVFS